MRDIICEGSGKPVGIASRCEVCKISFGFPHPANLVVGAIAPEHEQEEEITEDDTLGPCGCTDYHMADCPTRTGDPYMRDYDPDPYDWNTWN